MAGALADLLEKNAKRKTPAARTETQQPKPQEENKRKYIAPDGKEIPLEDLSPEETKSGAKKLSNRTGKGFHQFKSYKYEIKRTKNFLAPVFTPPEFLKKTVEEAKKHSVKYYKYQNAVLTNEKLRKPTAKVVKNKNPQGLSRYIFISELVACKNGLLYYTLPLIVNIIFLIINLTRYAFLENVAVSVVAVADIVFLYRIFTRQKNILIRLLLTLLLIGANVGLYFLGRLIPNLYDKIYLPFAIKLVFICLGVYYFAGYYVGFLRVYYDDLHADFGNVVKVVSGPPRVGKTSLSVHEAFIMAKHKWALLQYEYWLWHSREKEILERNNLDELLRYEEIKLSYDFYSKSKCIPCLWSSTPIFDKSGRACHKITLDHMKGLKRLPVYSVVLFDEIGAAIRADDGLNRKGIEKPLDISDMFRLGGQFIRWTVYCTEQDYNHIFIDVRRVVGQNVVISRREWRNKPRLLFGIYTFLRLLKVELLDKRQKQQPKRANFLRKLEKFVYSIGFAATRFGYRTNTQTNGEISEKDEKGNNIQMSSVRTRWIPNRGVCLYNHEGFKPLYGSYYDVEIEGELFLDSSLDGRNEGNYEFVNTTDDLSEKREAQKEALKKLR